ncbi:hypothetical protein [Cupriavidus sp. AU9028]|uniref:hypothetical protein n=1 Tax=Cupriavidus sp. AU9028 TaxID=2871157 RepID=UPI001C9569A8|nr:hypothetical protein [Cupriavidus sp. AU9028]MBY4895624.1 hypothetical protein [Cupriavidus sp. AU9028]
MVFRNLLRGFAASTVTAMSLLWLATSGYGQSGAERPGNGGSPDRLLPPGMERIMMRTGSPDHVRAQIERMEARARADDRLSGRAGDPRATSTRAAPSSAGQMQAPPNPAAAAPVGPGWQNQGEQAAP